MTKNESAIMGTEGRSAEGGGTHIDFHFGARTRPPHCVFLASNLDICRRYAKWNCSHPCMPQAGVLRIASFSILLLAIKKEEIIILV